MNIQTKATNLQLTPNIEAYLEKRITPLHKFISEDDSPVLCEVEVGKTTDHHQHGDIYRAEINLTVSGKLYRAESKKEKLYDAIDDAKGNIARELRRNKQKSRRSLRQGALKIKEMMRGFYDGK